MRPLISRHSRLKLKVYFTFQRSKERDRDSWCRTNSRHSQTCKSAITSSISFTLMANQTLSDPAATRLLSESEYLRLLGTFTKEPNDESNKNYGSYDISRADESYGIYLFHMFFKWINLIGITRNMFFQDNSTDCSIEKVDDSFQSERKKLVQRVSSFVIATTVFLWIIRDICSQLSIFQLQPEPIWSSLLELLGFIVFVYAVAAMIVVGAPFSPLQSAMLMFWAILMFVRSAKSITQVYVPILGILLIGGMCLWKSSHHMTGNEH